MVLSSAIPWGTLPAWMYHAQNPPPTHALNTAVTGITWVDLVFPFFLFAMGAAIPLALNRRLSLDARSWKIVPDILHRGFLLACFAILHQHLMPHVIGGGKASLLISITGFLLMFAIFMPLGSFPKQWIRWAIRGGGWLSVVILLSLVRYPDGSGFSLARSNIILVILANMAVFGSLIWLVARNRTLPLLAVMAFLVALRLAATEEGWVQLLWNWSPAPWIYQMRYLQYLLIVIPGILAGNLLWQWMQGAPGEEGGGPSWSRRRWTTIALLMLIGSVGILLGLQERWLWQTNAGAAVFFGAGARLMAKPGNATESFLKHLFLWGVFWTVLGLVFEPYEGGIKKSSATISYYFVSAGLACFLMNFFIVVIDVLQRRKPLQLLIDNGKNPMIAYVGSGLFIVPALTLLGLHELFVEWSAGPWLGFLRGVAYTLLLALMVRYFTRKKIFWRT